MKTHVTYSPVWQFGSLNSHYQGIYDKNQSKTKPKRIAENNKLSSVYSAEICRTAELNNMNKIQTQEVGRNTRKENNWT